MYGRKSTVASDGSRMHPHAKMGMGTQVAVCVSLLLVCEVLMNSETVSGNSGIDTQSTTTRLQPLARTQKQEKKIP